ncbi:MAG: signal peptidase II, partial [Candidatus Eremiobacteraeota bacterium]|nr:signal peptidase II [Candidatus Eremiobacteraeota bacterium]
LLADQLTKQWILRHCAVGQCRQIVPGMLNWTFEQNTHGAFGFFGSSPVLLIAMALVVLTVFWFSFREAAKNSLIVRIAFGLILGGAIGNIIDRIHFQYVIDFIDFYRIWPNIFNVADSCITGGVILLIVSSLATRRHA